MQKITFYKFQGAGNDFILVDNRDNSYSYINNNQIVKLCDRHFGIGSDGFILINDSVENDFEMDFYNPDGSQSFCGNGARCAIAFYALLTNRLGDFNFMAFDGIHSAVLISEEKVRLKMADVEQVKVLNDNCFELNTGSPHYVLFTTDIGSIDVQSEGSKVRYSEHYKEHGINVNFVEILKNDLLSIRTYERGVENETLACGTGITAAVLSYAQNVKLSGLHRIEVQAKGGDLLVEFQKDEFSFKNIYLEGPSQFVFKGEVYV
jgi:diaminopimelate epimerase